MSTKKSDFWEYTLGYHHTDDIGVLVHEDLQQK